ncbi:MAG: hypothetical protein HYX54_00245 [Chloroflexi bacterium]|nr:hypothetical protein [Chloroflexota bacterium]
MTALRRRRPKGGAVFLSLAVIVAGCGPSLPPAASTSRPADSVPSPESSNVGGTPEGRLTTALMALKGGYTFETVLAVGGIEAASVAGRWYQGASELSITSSGATVTYRIIPPSAWLQDESGAWVEADAASATADPLSPLLAPSGIEIAAGPGGSDGTDAIVATYPAAALGLQGTDPVTVTISIAADGTISTRYETTLATGVGVSETVLKPAPAQDPISAPSPLPAPTP